MRGGEVVRGLLRAVVAATTVMLACGCVGKKTQAGGLELLIATNLIAPSQFDSITLQVQQQTASGAFGPSLIATNFLVPGETTLPTTFAILAGQSEDQVVLIQLEAVKNGEAVDLREVQVQVPTTRVAELTLILAESCLGQVTTTGGRVVSTCPSGQSCQPATGTCGATLVSTPLPTYDGAGLGPDATVGAFLRDSGIEAPLRDATTDTFVRDAFVRDAAVDALTDTQTPIDAVRPPTGPPRLIAPLSVSTVTAQRPTLRWQLPAGDTDAHVDLCSDRACSHIVTTFAALGESGTPPAALPPGVVFWRVVATVAGVPISTPVWEFVVGHRSAGVDTSWGATLDVNGDGFADLVVGAPGARQPDGGTLPGQAFVYRGSASGVRPAAAQTLTDGNSMGTFGERVVSVGDVNGDGFADLAIVTTSASSAATEAEIFLGSATGLGASPQVTLPMTIDIAGVGDMNGDGYADVVTGTPGYQYTDAGIPYTGSVTVYFGSATGLSAAVSVTLELPPPDFSNHISGGSGGRQIVGADFNGDGYGDVAISANDFSSATNGIFILLGGAGGPTKAVVATLTAASLPPLVSPAAYALGMSIGAADLDGDGFPELLAGTTSFNGGTLTDGSMLVYPGDPSGHFTADPIVETGTDASGHGTFGDSCASAGDVNGDGYEDVVVSDSWTSQAYLYFGGASGVPTTAASQTLDPPMGIDFGQQVGGLGDVNGDGYGDLFASEFTTNVYVFQGGTTGLASAPATNLVPATENSGFGGDVAGRE